MADTLTLPALGWWITGLVDGEGCFYAELSFRSKATTVREVDCVELITSFAIALRADDKAVLQQVHAYFGCGEFVRKKAAKAANAKPQYVFRVRKLSDIINKVLPHFESFPLQTKKAGDYTIWKKLALFTANELHGQKGWLRRYPDKVEQLGTLCSQLKLSREYVDPDGVKV